MKKKFNYTLDSNKYITGITDVPFIEGNSYIELTDEEFSSIKIGISRIINGKLNNELKSNLFIELQKLQKKNDFRGFREPFLQKYDLLRINVQNGDYDPKTGEPYYPITEDEKQWRLTMLNFTNSITHETTEKDYPEIPERLK